MTYRALLIGNSTFDADASLNPLNAPTKDVARLHRALVDPDSGMFEDRDIRLVTERKHDEILDELDNFFASGERDDLMLLYYSGHGVLDEYSNLYLCGRDTRSDRLARTGISDNTINDFIRGANSRRTVLVLDCCSSGMFKGGPIGAQLGGPGKYIISSARGKTLANDGQSPTGTSLFTEHLVEGLLGQAEDVNGDGLIDLHEIYEYVKQRLSETSKQVPSIRFDGDGDISLARRRQTPAIAVATSPEARPGWSGRDGNAPEVSAPARHSGDRPFGLTESVITLRDVSPDERLHPEIVEICRFSDDDMEFVVESTDDWLQASVVDDRVTVLLQPRPGANRGKVLVRDVRSGTAQVLRIEAFVGAPRQQQSTSVKSPVSEAQPRVEMPPPELRPAPPTPQPIPYPNQAHPNQPYPNQPYPNQPYPNQPPAKAVTVANPKGGPTNGLAIAALILSILWIYGIGSVTAIVMGRSAKRQIARTGESGSGLATAGIVIGWIGLALLAVVIVVALAQKYQTGQG